MTPERTKAFEIWADSLPDMTKHMNDPARTLRVVDWLVSVCGWDGVAVALETRAARERADMPEMLRKWGGVEAVPPLLRVAQHIVEAAT